MNVLAHFSDAPGHDDAVRLLRRVLGTTNLMLAGKRVAVCGEGAVADALLGLVRRLGALADPVELGCLEGAPRADFTFCLDGWGGETAVWAVLALSGPGSVVVDATATGEVVAAVREESESFRVARGGVWTVTLDDGSVRHVVPALTEGPTLPHDEDGAARIAWARRHMPIVASLSGELADARLVRGRRVGLAMILEPKTANLALAIREAGAEVGVFCDAASTDDAVAEALRVRGVRVWASARADQAEEVRLARGLLDWGPEFLLDDGSHLIRLAHVEGRGMDRLVGAAEETTSGVRPLRVLEREGALRVPVVSVNDARSKSLFDNAFGTGQTCVVTIVDRLAEVGWGDTLAGRRVAVAGYGLVGRGVARWARGFGAEVVVSEVSRVAALEARCDGFEVMPLIEAAEEAHLVVSATGVAGTIPLEVLLAMPAGAAVAVAGGVAHEVALDELVAAGAERTFPSRHVAEYLRPDGSRVLAVADGGGANYEAGEGNPVEIMDLSFGVQLQALRLLAQRADALAPGVHPLPAELDERVSALALEALGVAWDAPTARQLGFVADGGASWLLEAARTLRAGGAS